jgi:hypothetical protein
MCRGDVAKFPVTIAVLIEGKTTTITHAFLKLPCAEWATDDTIFPITNRKRSRESSTEEVTPQATIARVLIFLVFLYEVGMFFLPLLVILHCFASWQRFWKSDDSVRHLANSVGRSWRVRELASTFWACWYLIGLERFAEADVAVGVAAGSRVRFVQQTVADFAGDDRANRVKLRL